MLLFFFFVFGKYKFRVFLCFLYDKFYKKFILLCFVVVYYLGFMYMFIIGFKVVENL